MISKFVKMAITAAIVMTVAAVAVPAMAGSGDVVQRGNCSGSADWKLKLSPQDGRTEVEYEVDSNVNGQQWRVRITKNGNQIFQGTRRTHAPSGSFELRVVTSDPAGTDAYRARAVNAATGQVCLGTASI